MSSGLFSPKLNELDAKISCIHERIVSLENTDPDRLRHAIAELQQKYLCEESAIYTRLKFSKAQNTHLLAKTYEKIRSAIESAAIELSTGEEGTAEASALYAEYALDFAILAADRALLLSLKAAEAQNQEEKNGGCHERS